MVELKLFKSNVKNGKVKTVKTKNQVAIDYPQNGDVVDSEYYSFRISANFDAAKVEISLNGESWQGCRQAAGFWWFDWSNYKPEKYSLEARAYTTSGVLVSSASRSFKVKKKKV